MTGIYSKQLYNARKLFSAFLIFLALCTETSFKTMALRCVMKYFYLRYFTVSKIDPKETHLWL